MPIQHIFAVNELDWQCCFAVTIKSNIIVKKKKLTVWSPSIYKHWKRIFSTKTSTLPYQIISRDFFQFFRINSFINSYVRYQISRHRLQIGSFIHDSGYIFIYLLCAASFLITRYLRKIHAIEINKKF